MEGHVDGGSLSGTLDPCTNTRAAPLLRTSRRQARKARVAAPKQGMQLRDAVHGVQRRDGQRLFLRAQEHALVRGQGQAFHIIRGGGVGSSGNLEDLEIFDFHGGPKSRCDPDTL